MSRALKARLAKLESVAVSGQPDVRVFYQYPGENLPRDWSGEEDGPGLKVLVVRFVAPGDAHA